MKKEILLNAFTMNTPGHQSNGLWRHPRDRTHQYKTMSYWQDLARTLERGLFDGVFVADVTGLYDVYANSPEAALRSATQVPTNDPFTLVPLMAAVTEHLGFGITASIPYLHPYAFARLVSSLDHLTEGRMGWNVVTGYLDSAAKGTGKQQQGAHDTRYEIADEFMEVCYKLWEGSWQDDAVRLDAEGGIYTDPEKVRAVRHEGGYFSLNAIHLCEPSAQRSPVIYQAGASPKGMDFAGRHAECIFTANHDPNVLAERVRQQHECTRAAGRAIEEIKLFGMASVVVAENDAAAQEKHDDYQQYGLHEGALALLSGWIGVDLAQFDPDERIENMKSNAIQSIMTSAGAKTMRGWAEHLTVGGAAPVLVGSPSSVADQMEWWIEHTGIDGFNLSYTVMPECYEDFVDLVVPELQNRGIYKTEYRSGTLRDKLFAKGDRLGSTHPGSAFAF